MTVIAAIAHEGRVYMAADTGSQVSGTVYHNDHKIFTMPIKGSDELVVIGIAGNAAIKCLVRQHLKIGGVPKGDEDLVSWAAAIAEAICALATEANPAPLDDGWVDGTILMGFRGQLWLLNQQTAIPLTVPYSAVGSGGDLALGVLHARRDYMRDHEDVLATLDEAVHTACIYDAGCTVLDAGPRHLEA